MPTRFNSLWSTFCEPDTFFRLFEPLAIWGPLVGFLLFLTSWICKEPKSQKAVLVLVALVALSVFVVPAEGGGLRLAAAGSPGDLAAGGRALPGTFAWVYLVLAALAVLTVFLGRGGRAGLWLTVLTLVACLATALISFELLTGTGPDPVAPEASTPAPAGPGPDGI